VGDESEGRVPQLHVFWKVGHFLKIFAGFVTSVAGIECLRAEVLSPLCAYIRKPGSRPSVVSMLGESSQNLLFRED
jgi:hypothetical protein